MLLTGKPSCNVLCLLLYLSYFAWHLQCLRIVQLNLATGEILEDQFNFAINLWHLSMIVLKKTIGTSADVSHMVYYIVCVQLRIQDFLIRDGQPQRWGHEPKNFIIRNMVQNFMHNSILLTGFEFNCTGIIFVPGTGFLSTSIRFFHNSKPMVAQFPQLAKSTQLVQITQLA